MNGLEILKADHRTVNSLFEKYEKAGKNAVKEKQQIAKDIIRELAVHASVEEQLLYPFARLRDESLADKVLEALEEHHIAKWTLSELEKMNPTDERFDAKMTVLIENIRHHVEEEETDLFPKLEKVLQKEELEGLADAIVEAKKTAPTHPHPMAPDTPPGNFITGALAKIVDSAKDRVAQVAHALHAS